MDLIRTPRLVLRTWEAPDAAAFHALHADSRVSAFLPGAPTLAQAEAFVEAQQELFARSRACYFAATLAETGELAGFVGLRRSDSGLPFSPCTDIGWRLAAQHWGKGYALEGARACLAFGFDRLGLDEIVAFTVPANLRSRALMDRLGMREDTAGAFPHPALPLEHPLARHLLYRLRRPPAS